MRMCSTRRLDWKAFQLLAKSYFEKEFGLQLRSEVKLTLDSGEAHRFDLASEDAKIIVFDDDLHVHKGSLAGLFARRNKACLADASIWRHWQGTFKRVYPE
jgi:hypothetical protein